MGLVSFDAVEAPAQTANQLIKRGPGAVYGFIVVESTGGNIALFDNTSATGTALVPPRAVTTGDIVTFGGLGVKFDVGLYFQLVSGTATVRVLYK